MPSPDITDLVDLTLYDPDPQAFIDRALELGQELMPGWQPREHNIEVILIELLAEMATDWIYALNRLPAAVTEVLLKLFDVPRDVGAQATGTAVVTLSANAAGVTVPAGARFRVKLGSDEAVATVTTQTTIASPDLTGSVPITVSSYAAWPNSVPSGTGLTVVDPVPQLLSIATSSTLTGGRDPETSDAYLARVRTRLARLTEALVLPAHFEAAALEDPRVERAKVINLYNGDGTGPPYNDAGHVTVVARGPSGDLSDSDRAELSQALSDRAVASLDVHVIAPSYTTVPVTVTVAAVAGATPSTVVAAVTAALENYLSPATWPWSAVVRRNELIALIDGVTDVDFVAELNAPSADLDLSGDGPLAVAGAISVTVQ